MIRSDPPSERTRQLMAARKSMLGRKQEETIAALLTQRNLDEAAKAAGISMRTLMRWLKLPEFQAVYRDAAERRIPKRSPSFSKVPLPRQRRSPSSCLTRPRRRL